MNPRYLTPDLKDFLNQKMVFLGGPRQVGKTTLSKSLSDYKKDHYFNWDNDEHRTMLLAKDFPPKGLIVFDEIHKFKKWRNWLKGIYDTKDDALKILVTGSARLDLYRYGGDSLQGRYFYLRLHPLTFAEIKGKNLSDLMELFKLGGFPEPFYSSSEKIARLWSKQYRERLVREDVPSLERIDDIGTLEILAKRLPQLVGSPLSTDNLRQDLDKAFKTIKNWLDVFDRMYLSFRLRPANTKLVRAVKKEQKYYLYDWTLVEDNGLRFENMVACHLLKWVNYMEDTQGLDFQLRFYRDRDNREVDFVIEKNDQPQILIECKWSETQVSESLRFLKLRFPKARAVQVVMNPQKEFKTAEGIEVISAVKFLSEFI